ncbi:MAG: peptidylarginine deiminase, partial [Candidatus Marinimicrobia bacterium]|nr:peptidylarginine deiminase [Candidatus Neomarinimicrobiota bacterium]
MKSLYILFCLPLLYSEELPIGLTDEEILRTHEIPLMARETDPPIGPIRNIAEYEKMQGVLIRYPFGIPIDLIVEIAEDVKIFCLVSNNQQNAAQNALINAGVDANNIDLILGETDSYWTRDYGPWWVVNGE